MNNGRAIPLINSVCYVRLAVSEPSASARFVSDIFGLQRVADQDGEIAFRSDEKKAAHRRLGCRCPKRAEGKSVNRCLVGHGDGDDVAVRLRERGGVAGGLRDVDANARESQDVGRVEGGR